MTDQAAKLRRITESGIYRPLPESSNSNCRVIAVTSGKGGVGKTNITVNLALALISLGKRVIIIDADIGLANIDVVLGITPQYDISSVINGARKMTEIISEGPYGLKFIAGGSITNEIVALSDWQLDKMARGFIELEDFTDIILIDTGAGISKNVLSFVMAAPEVLVVTTPEPTSMADAYGIIKMLKMRNAYPKINLVVNRAESHFDSEDAKRKLIAVSKRFLGIEVGYMGDVPNDPLVSQCVRKQQPFFAVNPAAPASQGIQAMANKIAGTHDNSPQENLGGMRQFFTRLGKIIIGS